MRKKPTVRKSVWMVQKYSDLNEILLFDRYDLAHQFLLSKMSEVFFKGDAAYSTDRYEDIDPDYIVRCIEVKL